MTCPKCNYEWKKRVVSPKECPQCKARMKRGAPEVQVQESPKNIGKLTIPLEAPDSPRYSPESRHKAAFVRQFNREPSLEELEAFIKRGW